MDTNKAVALSREFANLVLKEFSPQQILLYGSYAKGAACEESDIDIAIVFEEIKEDWLKNESRLWRLAWSVDELIEPISLESKDDSNGFLKHIRSYAKQIYPSAGVEQ